VDSRNAPFTPTAERPGLLYGLRVASEFALPAPATSGPIDVTISLASVVLGGELLWQTDAPFPVRCYRDGGWVLFDWPNARFAVSSTHVVVDAQDVELAAHLLLHVIWSIVLDERGIPALHGSAAEFDGRGVAVLGLSGSGKSTAVLAMLDRGWRLVSDDLLTFDAEARVIPGPPFVRLTDDRACGRPGEVDPGGKLRYFPAASPVPAPLAAIVVHDAAYEAPTRLWGMKALDALLRQVYIPLPPQPGQARRRYGLALRLVEGTPVYATPPRSLDAAALEQLVGEANDDGVPSPQPR
jgi:hypothetical protein